MTQNTPPADDVREALDHLDAMNDPATLAAAAAAAEHTERHPRGTVAEADDDDVRDMLAQTICVSVRHMHGGNECDSDYTTADAILAAFEVRPHGAVPAGQVSDAEVETVLQALGHSRSGVTTSRMRAALEAAREAR